MTEHRPHPDLAVSQLDRARGRVVRPQIEGAAAFEVKAGVVPVAGEDAVLDAAPVEREAHVRAPIVERKDAPVVMDDEDRAMGAMHDEPPWRGAPRACTRTNSAFTMTPPLPAAGSTS